MLCCAVLCCAVLAQLAADGDELGVLCFVPLPKLVPTALAFDARAADGHPNAAERLLVGTADGRLIALVLPPIAEIVAARADSTWEVSMQQVQRCAPPACPQCNAMRTELTLPSGSGWFAHSNECTVSGTHSRLVGLTHG